MKITIENLMHSAKIKGIVESLTCHFLTETLNLLLLYKNTAISVLLETVLFVAKLNGSVISKAAFTLSKLNLANPSWCV